MYQNVLRTYKAIVHTQSYFCGVPVALAFVVSLFKFPFLIRDIKMLKALRCFDTVFEPRLTLATGYLVVFYDTDRCEFDTSCLFWIEIYHD